MVMAVCERVLGGRHEAEDAFQATFLVLAEKAGSIDRPELLSHWLHGVAYRIAYKVKAQSARRRATEARAAVGEVAPQAEPSVQAAWREVEAVLDEELNGLPDKYRLPLVLVYLEGKTHVEAAALMGCPAGTMSWRLERAREQLRSRLQRRGLRFSSLLLLLFLRPATTRVSAAVVDRTVNLALVPTSAPAPIATLTQAADSSAAPRWLPLARPLLVLAVSLALGAGAWAFHSWSAGAAGPDAPENAPAIIGPTGANSPTAPASGCGQAGTCH
jgi:RNA polymerase sigma factor (sigma-70 family)